MKATQNEPMGAERRAAGIGCLVVFTMVVLGGVYWEEMRALEGPWMLGLGLLVLITLNRINVRWKRFIELSSGQGPVRARERFVVNDAGEGADSARSARHIRRDELLANARRAQGAGDGARVLVYLDELIEIERQEAGDPAWRAQRAVSFAWRAAIHLEMGNCQQSIEDCKTCQRIDPNYWKVNRVLEDAEAGLNREVARARLDRRGPPDPDDADRGAQESETWIKGHSVNETLRKPGRSLASVRDAGEPEEGIWRVGELAFGKIEILKIITEGGMGTIYCGWDRENDIPVALKSLNLESERYRAVSQEGFRKEAERWLGLGKHRSIVSLFSVERVDRRQLVLRMEYVAGAQAGPTLSHRLRDDRTAKQTKLSPSEAARIAVGVCEAMDFVHGKGQLVHRDLKPSNVFITATGEIKVGDFGLAIEEGEPMGSFVGTPAYAAPEQWSPGARASAAVDMYAIGVMLFEMICGRRPFELPEDVRHAAEAVKIATFGELHRKEAVPDPSRFSPDLSPEYSSVIRECLSKEPEERPGSFGELRRRLGQCSGLQLGPVRTLAEPSPLDADLDPILADRCFEAYRSGVSRDSLGQFEEALVCYRESVEHEPLRTRRSEAWCNMARVLSHLDRHDEAVEAARRALAIDQGDHQAQGILAEALTVLGSYEEAKQWFDLLMETDPNRVELYLAKGRLLHRTGDFEGATSVFLQALELSENDPDAWNGLGLCAESGGDTALALKMFSRAIEEKVELSAAHGNRARVLLVQRDKQRTEDALREASAAAEYKPNDPHYQMEIGVAIALLGDEGRGAQILAHSLELNPESAEICFCLAGLYEQMGQMEKAQELGKRAMRLAERGGFKAASLAKAWKECHADDRVI